MSIISISELSIPEGTELRILINNDNEIEKQVITLFLQTPTYRIFDPMKAVKRMFTRNAFEQQDSLQSIVDDMAREFAEK